MIRISRLRGRLVGNHSGTSPVKEVSLSKLLEVWPGYAGSIADIAWLVPIELRYASAK